jgi:hypothetical protein
MKGGNMTLGVFFILLLVSLVVFRWKWKFNLWNSFGLGLVVLLITIGIYYCGENVVRLIRDQNSQSILILAITTATVFFLCKFLLLVVNNHSGAENRSNPSLPMLIAMTGILILGFYYYLANGLTLPSPFFSELQTQQYPITLSNPPKIITTDTPSPKPTIKPTDTHWPTHNYVLPDFIGIPDGCVKWDTVSAENKGDTLCVYGEVLDSVAGDKNRFYIRFGEDKSTFRMLVMNGDYFPVKPGMCVYQTGVIKMYDKMPYMELTEDVLHGCQSTK